MNSYRSLRKRNNSRLTAVISLLLCVVLSATVLFSRLVGFVPADTQHYIPLTRSGGTTLVREGFRSSDGAVSFRAYHPDNHRLLTANPGMKVYDENTVWESVTDIEIFKVSYENGQGHVSVNSTDGKKVIAPGTANTYRFTLENTGNMELEFSMNMKAWFTCQSDPSLKIPVLARVTDYNGNCLAGSRTEMAPVLELNNVSQSGTLHAGFVAPYTLEWEWPFEGDDTFDTYLGNLAVGEDITLTIQINVTSTMAEDPTDPSDPTEPGGSEPTDPTDPTEPGGSDPTDPTDPTKPGSTPTINGGLPKTGDSSHIQLALTVMMASGAGLLILLAIPQRKRRNKDEA